MTRLLRDNGLTLVLLLLFVLSIAGQIATGVQVAAAEAAAHGRTAPDAVHYLGSGEFLSALFENWESEFLQMSAFVILTSCLVQRGSPESKDPDQPSDRDEDRTLKAGRLGAPAPLRQGAVATWLYSRSLGIALSLLFVMSFLLHWRHSARLAAEKALDHGAPPPDFLQHVGSAAFWFESFQNWQSEFLSTAVLIVLSIYLRQKGSPESKPVAAPHEQTGA